MSEKLETALGYSFKRKGLLEEALTHPSCAKPYSNQRLEFLGDSVLGMLVANALFRLFPKDKEGDLHKRLSAVICGESLVRYAREKGLVGHLHLSESEKQAGGQENPTNVEDLVEALIGAVYLDGGMEAVEATFLADFEALAKGATTPPRDPKTALQEWVQARGQALPKYTVIASEGPAHAPVFTIEVATEDGTVFSATAGTKRLAEREAARLLLAHKEGQSS
ncbi:MAG: ribonuclease III [Alphaproteobacteria bacterium]|nr:ribonuclease III [Alphaproteobacteria bacterium]